MKKHIFAVLLGSLLLTHSPTAFSAYNYDPSGSLISDATILPSGYSSYYLYYDHQRFGSAYGGQYDSNLVGGIRVGVRDHLEVGLSLPVRANHGENDGGMPYIMAHARMQVASMYQGQQRLYLNVYRSSGELKGRPAITSGLANQGFYLGFHNERGKYKTRYLLGVARADTRYYSVTGGYAESRRYMLSAGTRFGEPHNKHLWLDFILKMDAQGAVQNTYAYIAPTFEFPKVNGTSYFIGVAFGFPTDKAAPHTEVVMGMSYRPPQSGHVYTNIPVTKQGEIPATEVDEEKKQEQKPDAVVPAEKTDSVGHRSAEGSDMVNIDGGSSESGMIAGAQAGNDSTSAGELDNSCKASIEIIYFTGQKQRALTLATNLKAQGYCVKSVQAQNLSILKSEIYSRTNMDKEVLSEVKDISGAQQHSVRQLPWGTDIRILLGKY